MHLLFLLNYCKEKLCETSSLVVNPVKYLNSGHMLHEWFHLSYVQYVKFLQCIFPWSMESTVINFVNIYGEFVCRKK